MRGFFVAALLLMTTSLVEAQSGVERVHELGLGFRSVTRAEPTVSSFESIAHFEYLYYGSKKLCPFSSFSLAPSKKFAIYQLGTSGSLFLYRNSDQRFFQLGEKPIGLAESYVWKERDRTVEVHIEGSKTPTIFRLP